MSPTAVFTPSNTLLSKAATLKGPSLVIGSPATAQDGTYQSLITSLSGSRDVERQMLDRLLDGGASLSPLKSFAPNSYTHAHPATTLKPTTYSSIHIILCDVDYQALLPQLPDFLSQLLLGLSPLGILHLLNLPLTLNSLSSELTVAGFLVLSNLNEGAVFAQKPAYTSGTSLSLKSRAATDSSPLPSADKERMSSKKALWTLTSPSAPTIDPESLLTPADRERPIPTCEPVNPAAPRRKRACKTCTCGLIELEAKEAKQGKIVVLDGREAGAAVEVE